MVGLTDAERIQQRLRAEFKAQQANETMAEHQYTAYYAYQEEMDRITKDVERENMPSRPNAGGRPIQTFRDRRG